MDGWGVVKSLKFVCPRPRIALDLQQREFQEGGYMQGLGVIAYMTKAAKKIYSRQKIKRGVSSEPQTLPKYSQRYRFGGRFGGTPSITLYLKRFVSIT